MGEVFALFIRGVRYEDLDEILTIEEASFPDPWSRNAFLREFQGNPSGCRVAAVGDAVVGYVIARIETAFDMWGLRKYGRCHLANLAVAPEYRDRGIGSRLLRETIRYARKEGAREVYLEVRAKNIPARRFYSKRGFVEGRYKEGYYRDDDAVIMTRELDSPEHPPFS
jgi:ribosomal-protein-alanine N-acetyltransferase